MNLDNVANSCKETRCNEYMEKKSRDTTRNFYMKTFVEYIIWSQLYTINQHCFEEKKHIEVRVENGMIDIIYFAT